MTHRSGFVSFVGRPNAGKSTLTNALLGEKVAITSSKPQTTRRAIRGILTRPDAQVVIVDTPGMHRPRTLLGKRLNATVRETIAAVDVIAVCVPADEAVGPGDRFIIAESEAQPATKRIAVVTKVDRVRPDALAAQLQAVADAGGERAWDAVVPVSARDGAQLDVLVDEIVAHLPEAPPLYPEGEVTDEATDDRIAELVREAALERFRDELPHSILVTVDEVERRADGLTLVYANLWVERESQKGIVIGRGGEGIRAIGQAAREEIELLLGSRVHLDLRVRVAKEWQGDPKQLERFGF